MAHVLNLRQTFPAGYDAMSALSRASHGSGLEKGLLELVNVRASQLNGCAFCLDMHTKDALALGESEQRLHLLAAWREAPGFSEREQAALELTEALTLIAGRFLPEEVLEQARSQFTEEELSQLLFGIATINAWNRLMIGSRTPAGNYRSRYTLQEAHA